MKVYIETLGCKVNQYESSCILDDFVQNGYEFTSNMANADVIIINTCTVTNRTDYKSRYLINQAIKQKQQNPDVKIVVTGCYSQREIQDKGFTGWELIDLIVDNNNKNLIGKNIHNFLAIKSDKKKLNSEKLFNNSTDFNLYCEMNMNKMYARNRAFLKIQDGCDMSCTYCAVPSARGKSRSSSIENILSQVEILVKNGYKEIVLGGINLGLFDGLNNLLFKFWEISELKRIRLSSIEPQLFTDDLLHTIKQIDKICSHFHIPLQSGSDTLLKRHNRKYNIKEYKDLITKIQTIKPDCALGFDVIVGLPGETEELFNETFELLNNIDFTYLHVFIYSKRRGTPAAKMTDQVHGTVAKDRSKKLIQLSDEKKAKYIQKLIEKKIELSANVENKSEDGLLFGVSDRYITAYFKEGSSNKLIPVKPYLDGVYCDNSQ